MRVLWRCLNNRVETLSLNAESLLEQGTQLPSFEGSAHSAMRHHIRWRADYLKKEMQNVLSMVRDIDNAKQKSRLKRFWRRAADWRLYRAPTATWLWRLDTVSHRIRRVEEIIVTSSDGETAASEADRKKMLALKHAPECAPHSGVQSISI